MAVTIEGIEFDSHEYDDRGDASTSASENPGYLQRLTRPRTAMPSTSVPTET